MRGRFVILLACAAVLLLFGAPAVQALPGMYVSDITPTHGARGAVVDCTVSGHFYHPLSPSIFAPSFSLTRGGYTIDGWTTGIDAFGDHAYVSFDIPLGAPTGLYTLEAWQTTEPGPVTEYDFLTDAFEVTTGPHIRALDPDRIIVGANRTDVMVFGSGFVRSTAPGGSNSIVLIDGREVSTWFVSDTKLVASIPGTALLRPGILHVAVVNRAAFPGGDVYSNVVDLPVYVPPVITGLTPSSVVKGGPAFTLTVTGSNFAVGWGGAVVRWNNYELTTMHDSTMQLRATVPASLIATEGVATITVRNGGPGAPLSNGMTFTILAPTPVLTALSPTSVWAGYVKNDIVLSVTGSNFMTGARITLNGVEKTNTTFVGATQVTVPLAAADIANPGTVSVGVKNAPFPPGYPSATTLPLTVAAETTTPQVTIAGADSSWHNSPVLLSFAASDSQSGVQKVQYMAPPGVPSWTDGTTYTVPTTTQGAITVSAQALDWCNKVGSATATVYIDTTQPRTRTLSNCSVRKGGNARLKFRVDEPSNLSPKSKVVIRILRADGSQAKKLEYPSVPMNRDRVAGFTCNLKKGTYTWEVYATDLAGNTQANIARAKLFVN